MKNFIESIGIFYCFYLFFSKIDSKKNPFVSNRKLGCIDAATCTLASLNDNSSCIDYTKPNDNVYVRCDRFGRLNEISVRQAELTGTLPDLSLFKELTSLKMNTNKLRSTIPSLPSTLIQFSVRYFLLKVFTNSQYKLMYYRLE